MSVTTYVKAVMPLIELAAEHAKRRAQRVSNNAHVIWDAYIAERTRLMLAAGECEATGTVKPDRWSHEMTRDEFEDYLLNLGVWVEEHDEERNRESKPSV